MDADKQCTNRENTSSVYSFVRYFGSYGPCAALGRGARKGVIRGCLHRNSVIYYHYQSIAPPQRSLLINMRVNQEDKPGVFDLPPPEVKNKVKKLAKQTLEDVLAAISLIEKSTYQPLQIQPHKSQVPLSSALKDSISF